MLNNVILVGGGGHCTVVIDAMVKDTVFAAYGIVDPHLPKGSSNMGVPVIGGDDLLPALYEQGIRQAFIAVGSVGNCEARKRIYARLVELGFALPTIIHPRSVIAQGILFEEGTFVAAGVVINPGVKIGANVIVNTSASVDHDCEIGNFVHIAPGVTLSGGVAVGEGTHIGTGAKVVHGIKIGKNNLIRAGSVVTEDIPDAVGVIG